MSGVFPPVEIMLLLTVTCMLWAADRARVRFGFTGWPS